MKRILTLFAAALAFVGCSHDEVVTPNIPTEKPTYYATFADAEGESRTYLDEHLKLLWHNDDRISLFQTTCNEEYAFADPTGSNSGAFNAVESDSWVTGNQTSTTYAVYPYNAANALSNSEVLTIHFAAEQTYAEDSFGRGANTMVAATETATSKLLPFRNAGGYLMLKLYGENKTVKSIELKGNNDEVISGAATAEAKYGYLPSITMGAEGGKTITLTCEEAVTLGASEEEATVFWLVVPPVTFEKGFTITVTDANGGTYTKSTSKSTTIERNTVKPMAALNPTFEGDAEDPEIPEEAKPANNEIWYTTTDDQPIDLDAQEDGMSLFNRNAFEGSVQSHSYADGKGVITFDTPITKIGEGNQYSYGSPAFTMYATLESLILPEGLVDMADRSLVNLPALEILTLPSTLDLTQSSFREMASGLLFRCPSLKQIKGEYATEDGRAWIKNNVMYVFAPTELTSYTVPSNVTELGDELFHECKLLTNLTLPQGLLTIGDSAIRYCSGLKTLNIPQTVQTIGQCAISFCESLLELVIPIGVTRLEHDALSGNSALTSLTLPEGLLFIDNYVFDRLPQLKKIIIPSTVEQIGQCFDNSAKEIHFLAVTPPKGSTIFLNGNSYHHADTRIYVPFGCSESYKSAWSDLVDIIVEEEGPSNNEIWYTTSDGQPLNIDTDAFSTSIASHNYNNGKGLITFSATVTGIEEYAFYGKKTLTSITLPNSITNIGTEAFSGSGLTYFVFPTSLTSIGYNALGDCPIETLVCNVTGNVEMGQDWDYYRYEGIGRLPNLTKVEGAHATSDKMGLIINGHLAAFAGKNLSSYTIPSSVRYIDSYVFAGCKMQSLTLHSNLSVYANAFFVANIKSISIPNGVFVYDNGFYMCYSDNAYIDTQTIDGTSEDTYGPYEYARFSEVTIGPNVKYIGESALNASIIYCKPTTPPTCWARPFSDVATIYVPKGYLNTYKSASYWSEYASKMVEY